MNAPIWPVYGGQVPAKTQVEGEPTIYWRGLPMTYTTCDYDSDEIMAVLKHKFCMGMSANALPRTLKTMGFNVQLGDTRGRGR